MLKSLKTWIRKYPWLTLGGALMSATVLLVPTLAFAAESDTATQILRDFTSLVSTLLTFLNYLLYPMVMVAGALMDNEMLIGPAMENKLLAIWVEIRNWVNMFFVLLLVGIAMYNVLGIAGDGSNYALKSILPKIVIGLVAVNFSFLAGKLLIDSTAVLTNAVYALPTGASLVDWDKEREEMRLRLCRIPKWIGEGGAELEHTEANTTPRPKGNSSVLGSLFCEGEESGDNLTGNFSDFGQSFFSNFGQHNIAVSLMVQMGNVSGLNTPDEMGLQSLSQITFQMLFNIIIFVMFGFAYAALIVVLVARVIVLWIVLALSPVVILLFVLPDLSNFAGGEFDFKKQFFQHLFAPLIIGVVLSIGFTMLNTLQENGGGSWLGRIGEINLGTLQDTTQVSQLASTYGTELSNFQSLLVAIGAVLVIWMGVFAAAKQTVASGIVETIKGAGQKFGKFMASTPLYATVIPVHKGGEKLELSLGGLLAAPALGIRRMEDKQRKKQEDAARALGLLPSETKIDKHYEDMHQKISTPSTTLDEGRRELREYLKFKEAKESPDRLKKTVLELTAKLPESERDRIREELKGKEGQDFLNWLHGAGGRQLLGNEHFHPNEHWTEEVNKGEETESATTTPATVAPVVTAATAALASVSGPLSSNVAALVSDALSSPDIQNDVNLTALFSNPDETNLVGDDGAIAQFRGIKEDTEHGGPAAANTILQSVTAANGKIDSAAFVQAVRKHGAPAAPAPGTAGPGTPSPAPGATPPPAGAGP